MSCFQKPNYIKILAKNLVKNNQEVSLLIYHRENVKSASHTPFKLYIFDKCYWLTDKFDLKNTIRSSVSDQIQPILPL